MKTLKLIFLSLVAVLANAKSATAKTVKCILLPFAAAVILAVASPVFAAEEADYPKGDVLSIDEQRKKDISKYDSDFIPDPGELESKYIEIFALALDMQQEDDLKELASDCNRYANLVGYIEDEYRDYRRENYRYDFVLKKITPAQDAYTALSNKFKDCRNRAYFNLGEKALLSGNEIDAFFYFRDAYRLASFSCIDGASGCVRLDAEKKMKKILNIRDITSYVHWQ